jgi:Ca-activated chloride channel family protein
MFSGVPQFVGDAAVLFDSARPADAGRLPEDVLITRVEVAFPAGALTGCYATPRPESLDPGLSLLIFVDDLSAPRAQVRLADIVRQGGSRPLNLRRASGQAVRIVLADPAGAWRQAAPAIAVTLAW